MKFLFLILALLQGMLLLVINPSKVIDSGKSKQLEVDFRSSSVSNPDYAIISKRFYSNNRPTVSLHGDSGKLIRFKTQNGWTVGDVPIEIIYIPHLVLFQNGSLTDPIQRSLTLTISGIEVPTEGVTVTLEVETQHGDPDLGGNTNQRISVWHESKWIDNHSENKKRDVTVIFSHEFSETSEYSAGTYTTPTDYFRYTLKVFEPGRSVAEPIMTIEEDYAFLMESQWIAQLPEVREESVSAAPNELIVYFCDMFPFQKSVRDDSTRLLRNEIHNYIHNDLGPGMLEVFRIQSSDWGFIWYGDWTSSRPGADSERLSVALTKNGTWYHGRAPARGHSWISISVEGGVNAYYENLTDGLISAFYHELFHNLQRNMSLELGGNANIDGKEDAWQFFTEGMAVFASSIGMTHVQFSQTTKARAYLAEANKFVAGGGLLDGELNNSYKAMFPYRAAIYWRFLYEKCGGMNNGNENPAAGMVVIRDTLMILYNKSVIDIQTSADLLNYLPVILDRTLESSRCPFKTYRESLTAFASDIYALGLEGGKCVKPGVPVGCGFYDPNNLYMEPSRKIISANTGEATYASNDQPDPHQVGIPSSFGMDFVEVELSPELNGQALTIKFIVPPRAVAEFIVQIWRLKEADGNARLQSVRNLMTITDDVHSLNREEGWVYVIPEIDTTEIDRLVLIIVRVDNQEKLDPRGEYTISIRQ